MSNEDEKNKALEELLGIKLNVGSSFTPNTSGSSFVPSSNPPTFQPSIQTAKSGTIGAGTSTGKVVSIGGTPKPAVGAGTSSGKVVSIGGASKPTVGAGTSTGKTISIGGVSAPSKADSQPVSKSNSQAVQEQSPKKQSELSQPSVQKTENVDWSSDEDVKDVLNEMYKEHVNVIFMGHVDAGKSTMGGNILFLTGMVDARTMEKYEKEAKEAGRESWYLSWALDLNQEERAKGKTVECGRAFFETDKRRYTILDAPGHKNYVPSMIGGASQADVGVLVISARKGEFETGFERGGQTREHAVLAKTSGINHLICVVNKMDDPTVNWSKERYDECLSKITPFLKGTGYNPKTDLTFIPVSGFTGANIKDRLKKGVADWYDGPALLEYLDAMEKIERKVKGPLMMPVIEKFKDMGTIILGKIESGKAKKNQSDLLLMPNNVKVEIQTIFSSEDDSEIDMAMSGDNVKIRLKGVEEDAVSVGFVLCSARQPVKVTNCFEVQLVVLDHKNIMCPGYSSILHIHSAIEEVAISKILHLIDKKTGKKSKRPPPFVKKGQKCIVILETTQIICVEAFKDYPQLGRFTLRDEGKTIAIGKVIRVLEPVSNQTTF